MPFTLAHPAIIIPIKRHCKYWFSTTGLMAGSIAPDIEGIYTLGLHRGVSHTIWGIFFIDLPISILISILFHQIIKQPLIKYSFGYFKKRSIGYSTFNWWQYCLLNPYKVCLSILVGVGLHITWDLLTHISDDAVRLDQVCSYLGITIQNISAWLQMTSSIIGLSVIFFYVHRLPVVKVKLARRRLFYWTIVLLIALAIIILKYWFIFWSFGDIFVLFKTILCGLFTGIFCASLLFQSSK